MGGNTKGLKWTRAKPIKKPDNIMSSEARCRGETGFIPSYDTKGEDCNMNFLMSNEYMRIWFKERGVYDKEVYGSRSGQTQQLLKRKYVVRKMFKPEPKPIDFMEMNRRREKMKLKKEKAEKAKN